MIMNRKRFIQSLALLPTFGAMYKLYDLYKTGQELPDTDLMPALFLGHGSPMNAIEENEFVQGFRKIGQEILKPIAILCVSAHWETNGTQVTAMSSPKTIHDFGGFPQALYEVQYPAPGSPELAQELSQKLIATQKDMSWGLDHGFWSVVKHLYPQADVPVIQLSLDIRKSASEHYKFAKDLSFLRRKGVLIIGSGNLVHNLGMVAWNKLNEDYAFDWAQQASDWMKESISNHNHQSLADYKSQDKAIQLAIPTPEHYLPLLYTLALQEKNENATFYNDKAVGGSLTMTSVKIS